jgi:TP901 family phage tail tape measure protein
MAQDINIQGSFQGQAIMTALLAMNNNLVRINTNLRIQNTLTRKLTTGHKKAAGATKGHANAMKGLALRFVGYNLAMNAVMGAQQKLIQLVGESIKKYREFETRLAEISTILQEDVTQMDRFKVGIESLSTTYGQATSDISKGLYDILSAAFDSRDAMNLLNTSIKASIAGLSDVRTSVKIFTTVLNSYGLAAEQATHVSDVLFQSVVRGKFQFADLEQALGYVVPIAAQAGISFDQLSAALSTATRHGLHIDMTARGLALAIQGIVNPSEKARKAARKYGVEMNGLALRVLELDGWFKQLGASMDIYGKSILGELIPNMRSLRVAMVLAGEEGAKGFADDLLYLEDISGRTDEALQKMMDTSGFLAKQLEQEMEVRLRNAGEAWNEFDLTIRESIIGITDNFQYAVPILGGFFRIFDDLKIMEEAGVIEDVLKGFQFDDSDIGKASAYVKAMEEMEKLSEDMADMEAGSREYELATVAMEAYQSVIDGTVDSYNKFVGAVKDTQTALGDLEITLDEIEIDITRLDKALNDTITVGWGKYQKTLEGTLGLELAQLEASQRQKDSQHDVKMGLIDSTYGWKTHNTALQEAVNVVREHEKAQKADTIATNMMSAAMRKLQIQALEIQLAGMMRRRGLTRSEEKQLKKIQIEQARLRLENMKATKNETAEMYGDYEDKKQFIAEFLARLEEESYQLKYTLDTEISELGTFIDSERVALETRHKWWQITSDKIFDTSYKLITDLGALPSPVKAFMEEGGYDVSAMEESARARMATTAGGISPTASLILRKSPEAFMRMREIGIPGFKRGIERVPHDMVAMVHRDERISPAGRDTGNGGMIIQQVTIEVQQVADIDSVEKMGATLGAVRQVGITDRMGRSKFRL